MSLRHHLVFALASLLLLAGCASGSNSSSVRRDADVISREEILASNRGNIYEVVEMIRPQWLRARSEQFVSRDNTGMTGVIVYMNESRFGDINSLRNIPARDVYEIRRFTATAASQRWGPGHSEGVILLSTRAPTSDR